MKKLLIVLAVFVTASMFAQAPQKMSYQAVIRNSSSALITSTTVGMQISILQGSALGTPVYVETQTPTSNVNGLVSLEIGTGITIDNFSTIDWSNGPYFIKTETDPTGGTSYTITGTSELLSVPYALHAKTAENIVGGISETDPVFGVSVASGITGTDITNWNNKLDTEIDGSVTNELQALTISNDTVYLSNGGFVKLPVGFDGQYSSLTGTPTNVSSFTNDAGYLTTEIDGSITNELQAISLSNDTIYLSNGGFVKLPAGFDGQYSSLTGTPTNVSSFTNDAGYLTSEVDGSVTNELQALTISNDTVYLSNGGFVKLPVGFDGQYSSLTGTPTNVSSFTNDAGYLTTLTEIDPKVGTNTSGYSPKWDGAALVTGAIYQDATGKVGIGTNSLTHPLEVRVPTTSGSQMNLKLTNMLGNGYNAGGSGVGILFAPDDAAIAKMGIFVERKAAWGFSTMHFLSRLTSDYTSADLSNSVMSLTQNGYLGIGTTTPSSLLNVRSSSYNLLKLETTGANSNANIDIATTGSGSAQFTQTGGAGGFTFYPNGVVGTPTLAIVPFGTTGNVGIGTTTPTVKLHVNGNAKFGASSSINIWEWDAIEKIGLDYNTANGDFNMRNPVAGKRLLGTISATGSWGIETTGGLEMVRITGSGNMGIGTTSPNAKLEVNGNLLFTSSATVSPAAGLYSLTVRAGDGPASGGTMTIRGGQAGSATGGSGGNLELQGGGNMPSGGAGYGNLGVAGAVNITGGMGYNSTGGNVSIIAGATSCWALGGAVHSDVTIRGGMNYAVADAASIIAEGGYVNGGCSGNSTGGNLILKAGVGQGAGQPGKIQMIGLPVYANNAAAIAGGLTAGSLYRTGADPDPVCVVH